MNIDHPKSRSPLPKDAERVFQGQIFDVYQWDQELFNGTHATFEKLKRPDTVIVVPITDQGNIIYLEEQQPNSIKELNLPGGRIEAGEAPDVAAARELLEETGYSFTNLEFWKSWQPVLKIEWGVYLFIARGCTQVQGKHLDAGEKVSVKKATVEEFIALVSSGALAGEELQIDVLKARLDPVKMQSLMDLLHR